MAGYAPVELFAAADEATTPPRVHRPLVARHAAPVRP